MPIRISQLKDHYISVDQARYATSIVAKYLDIATIKENTDFHNTTLPHDIIFIKYYYFSNDEQVLVLSRE